MNDKPAYEDLIKLVNQVETATSLPNCWIASPSMWIYELQNNPEHFRRNDQDELIWLGYKVMTTRTFSNDEACFWLMADKIIPKENNND